MRAEFNSILKFTYGPDMPLAGDTYAVVSGRFVREWLNSIIYGPGALREAYLTYDGVSGNSCDVSQVFDTLILNYGVADRIFVDDDPEPWIPMFIEQLAPRDGPPYFRAHVARSIA